MNLEFPITNVLVRYANKMAGFYNNPVYLVGSQLDSDNPRDVDIVCIISDEEFKLRWLRTWCLGDNNLKDEIDKFYLGIHTGIHETEHWEWYRDMWKKTLYGLKMTKLPIDFKVQAQSYADSHYLEKKKLRLDTMEIKKEL